ncbi:MAG: helix-turn-helix domain-containing protein [Pseudonocardiaceae bacterium]|nr:helix-turn-helix domain-containing protein [Pseudonocardiaceae bacterium]
MLSSKGRPPLIPRNSRPSASVRKALGAQLAELRKAAGLTQDDLGGIVGSSRSTVANVELGYQGTTPRFWRLCDEALSTGGTLRTGFDQLEDLGRELHRAAAESVSAARQLSEDGAAPVPSVIDPAVSTAMHTLAHTDERSTTWKRACLARTNNTEGAQPIRCPSCSWAGSRARVRVSSRASCRLSRGGRSFHHRSVDNRLNAAVALAGQAREVAARVLA